MRTRTGLAPTTICALALLVPDPAPATQVCGCKRTTNGRVRRITAGNPLVCPTSQVLVCWNEDPPPGDVSARVFRSTNLTVPRGVGVAVDFDQERWDTDSIHSGATPTRLTVTTAGKYHIYGHVRWAVPSDPTASVREIGIRLNGGTFIASDRRGDPLGDQVNQSVGTHYELNAEDYVELEVHHTALPSTLDVVADAGLSPEFGMVKLP